MRTVKFWTDKEIKRIEKVYEKCNSQSETARILTKELGRSTQSIQVKVSKLFNNASVPRKRVVKSSSITNGVTLPTGFTFDIKPNRVVMFNDHVRLYF